MEWNERQSDAISSSGETLLVAAAAGSGKTAVLVERIIRLLCEEGRSLSEMLIVTFTQAAASEMKEKIYKALTDAAADPSRSRSEQRRLRSELAGIGRAHISTFHSFALDMIRNYYHVAGIRPGLSVCDDTSAAIMMKDAMDELFEARYEADDPDLIYFLDRYGTSKSDERAREMIQSFYTFLQSLPYPQEWMEKLESGALFDAGEFYAPVAAGALKALRGAIACNGRAISMLEGSSCVKLAEKAKADGDMLEAAAACLRNDPSPESLELLSELKWAEMRSTKDEKPAYELIKDEIKILRDNAKKLIKDYCAEWRGVSPELLAKEHEALKKPVSLLCGLTRDFAERYAAKKDKKGVLDFSDIEHFSLDILKNSEVCREYRESIAYIFVDEYQDSNLVQEELISRICREDNVFMVGDVKQSIYKFRLAEPEIFLGKYRDIKAGKVPKARVIDLNSNYRSKGGVIEFVNRLFSQLMTEESSGIVYDADAALVQGDSYRGELEYPVKLFIADSSKTEGEEDEELDPEIEEMKSDELEARMAVDIIRQYHGKPVYDSKQRCERPLRYADMVILMRALRGKGEIFYKTLSDAGLGVFLERGEGYFDTVEIQVFMSLLKLVDNSKLDVPLLSVLNSPVFGFSASDLAEIRIYANSTGDRRMPYNGAFRLYCEKGPRENLRARCCAFAERLEKWRLEARFTPLADMLWKLLNETGFASYASALTGGEQRIANLRALIDKASAYEASDSGGLFGFINYVDMLRSRGTKIDTGQVKIFSEGSDSVRIMTIHKSKGLEFPFVLLTGMGKSLSGSRGSDPAVFSRSLGVGMDIVAPKLRLCNTPFISKLIRQSKAAEEAAESIRLLYVAMTRPKDILVMSACVRNASKTSAVSALIPPGADASSPSYLKMVLPVMKSGEVTVLKRASFAAGGQEQKKSDFFERLENGFGSALSEEEKKTVEERLSFEYSGLAESFEKRKYSVSQLAGLEVAGLAEGPHVLAADGEEEAALERGYISRSIVPEFLQGEKRLTAAERGTAYHCVMEHIPFEAKYADAAEVKRFIEDLAARRILGEAEAATVEASRIAGFFRSDIGKRALATKELHREAPFVMKHMHAGREVMVQGTIDCYFEEGGAFVLIDYKSNYVDRESPEEAVERLRATYLPQLSLYREALEKICGKEVKEAVLYLFSIGKEVSLS